MSQEALGFFGLSGLGFCCASFHAGGATGLLESGVPISQIKFSGCWASEKAMSAYLQEAESAATLLSIPDHAARRLEKFLRELSFAASPPTRRFLELA